MSLMLKGVDMPKENEKLCIIIKPDEDAYVQKTIEHDPRYQTSHHPVAEISEPGERKIYCPFKKKHLQLNYVCAGKGIPIPDYYEEFMECIKEDCMAYHPEHNTGVYIIPAYCALCKPI